MELIRQPTPFLHLVAAVLQDTFTLVDIGCSGGIDVTWRAWGSRLRAFGFDPNLAEVERLSAAEILPGVEYIAAFIGPRPDDPLVDQASSGRTWERNPWARLSVARTLQIRAAETAKASDSEKTALNQWQKVALADRTKPLLLADFFRDRKVTDIDFIKIDVDGIDLLILRSLETILSDMNVLGLVAEVNFCGSHEPYSNTFHNIDRFMKHAGFELFDLTTRRYSVAALPAPYTYVIPAQGAWGRILQGDALYLRDAAAPEQKSWVQSIKTEKLLKLAAIFSMFGLPDCAAEILTRFRSQFAPLIDVRLALDTLVAEANGKGTPTYAAYLDEFERDASRFYPEAGVFPALKRKKDLVDIARAIYRRFRT